MFQYYNINAINYTFCLEIYNSLFFTFFIFSLYLCPFLLLSHFSYEFSFIFVAYLLYVFSYSKLFHRSLQKQGIKFKLNTKVISAEKNQSGKVDVVLEPAKGGSSEKVQTLYCIHLKKKY